MEIPRPMRASTNVVSWNHNGGPGGAEYSSASSSSATTRPVARELGVALTDGVCACPVGAAAFLACARARACAWARALDFELAIELRFQCLDGRGARGRGLVVGQLADRRGGEVRRGQDGLGVPGRGIL